MILGAPLCWQVGHDFKELYMNEVQLFLDRGKSQTYAENVVFNALLPVSRKAKKDLLRTSKRIHCQYYYTWILTQQQILQWKKRKFLLNRVMQEKLLPDESDDVEEVKEEVKASVSYSESVMWFLYENAIVAFLLIIL